MNPQAAALLASLEPWSATPGDGWTRLRGLLEKHADSDFGRHHGFDAIRSPVDFRAAIPPMDFEAHRSWIERAAAGEKQVLACDEPIGFERTSGTSSRAKWIPLTTGLQEEFARGLAAWFGGWKRRCPEVFAGRGYWLKAACFQARVGLSRSGLKLAPSRCFGRGRPARSASVG